MVITFSSSLVKRILLICPECGEKISSYSKECKKCGFPIKEYMEENNLIDLNKEFLCTKCGAQYAGYGEESDLIYLKCRFCNGKVIGTDKTGKEAMDIFYRDPSNYLNNYAKKYIKDTFSEEAYERRLLIIKAENEHKDSNYYIDNSSTQTTQSTSSHVTCPYCKSTNTKKISTTGRVASVLSFGLLSKKVGKQWYCNDCKSYF